LQLTFKFYHYQKINTAQRLAPGKVFPAISLLGYPEELARAMLFVFGCTFICSDAATAKAVTFNPSILTKSVTLEGDIYDPQGSLSGGSSPMGGKILIDVQRLLEVEGELNQKKRELDEVQAEEERIKCVREEWRRSGRELEIKEHELKLFEEQIGGSNASRVGSTREHFERYEDLFCLCSQVAADVEEAQANIQRLKDAEKAATDKQRAAKAECVRLEKDMNEFKDNKEGKIEELRVSHTFLLSCCPLAYSL